MLFYCDVLMYLDFDDVQSTGDVRHIKIILPHLLFRYYSGKNSKYTIGILELL